MSLFRTRRSCVLCHAITLEPAMRLAATPIANEFVEKPRVQDTFPLTLNLCSSCRHLQLAEVVDPERLFSDYVYVSGTSPVFVKHFADYARSIKDRLQLGPRSLVVDVGSNDGTFLRELRQCGVERLHGVEPAKKLADQAWTRDRIPSYCGYFSRRAAFHLRDEVGAADVVTANNVFAHADDLDELASAACALLHPDGEFIFEVSYLRDVVEKGLFDTVYHEHLSYHSLAPLVPFLSRHGLHLHDAERISTHGGSIRCYASRARKHQTEALKVLIRDEHDLDLCQVSCFKRFGDRIAVQGRELKDYIRLAREKRQKVVGFGAPAKLTTLMYTYELDGTDFEAIIDDAPLKQGLYTPGKNIPVRPLAWLADNKPDVVVVFAWNFFDSIVAKLQGMVRCILVNPIDGRHVSV